MSPTLIVIIAVALVVLFVWFTYNTFVTGKVRIKESLSGIDVQLKRRVDLVPNLIATVKGYAKHEKELLENVTKARSSLMNAKGIEEKAQSDNMLSNALKSLIAVSENYPDLKASKNFLALQEELSDIEAKIAYARQFFNTNVSSFNSTLVNFPSSVIGNMFGFKQEEFFEATEAERKNVEVKF
ncbi:MAG: LemA family protein [Candidatus Levybacteria bacterium]|nr:LemA family protein [Candidatus Levybacteria bacterium]MDZ4228386.1 LemA family protein [Candidatus Levybacteria bacterium]